MSKDDGRFSTVIRVDLREAFFSENKQGRLVNDLLEAHYSGKQAPRPSAARQPTQVVNLGTGEIVGAAEPSKEWTAAEPETASELAKWRKDYPYDIFKEEGGEVYIQHKGTKQWARADEVY